MFYIGIMIKMGGLPTIESNFSSFNELKVDVLTNFAFVSTLFSLIVLLIT